MSGSTSEGPRAGPCRRSPCRLRLRAALLAIVIVGCSRSADDDEAARKPAIARVSFALDLTDDVDVASATYTLTRPDGYRSSGALPISEDAGKFTGLMVLPVGTGYELAASALTATGLICAGTAIFDIWADRKTPVNLRLECPAPKAEPPAPADEAGILNACPIVQGIVAQPAERDERGFMLSGAAADTDHGPRALTYVWRATAGMLVNETAVTTTLRCTAPGIVTVTLIVSDGDFGCDAASSSLNVTCSSAADGTGDASVDDLDAGAVADDDDFDAGSHSESD